MTPVSDNRSKHEDNPNIQLMTRSQIDPFDWLTDCLICSKKCFPNKRSTWSMVTTLPSDGKLTIYDHVFKAAGERHDHQMLCRLRGIVNKDLVSKEARYHRSPKCCLATYVNCKQVAAVQKAGTLTSHSKQVMNELVMKYRRSVRGRLFC